MPNIGINSRGTFFGGTIISTVFYVFNNWKHLMIILLVKFQLMDVKSQGIKVYLSFMFSGA